ncbi:DNA-directed RNA polymerase I subunit RPA34 [Heteronotia binoei]|uniref:DNA-directed RNA polymerase I subunit RPA34 n=1 Tax=Heteronotia binoei TaxID=13085 RepID=UPI00292F8A7C|nr:DNA-directed RNA polymerase I subunit RPA34 [Heteronotia binoei]
MEAPQGLPRFKCPPDFTDAPFCPWPFSQETLQDSSKELWLIRTPSAFSPESFDGLSVSLLGSQTLKASQPGGTEKTFHVRAALEHLAGAHLLLPSGHGDRLACSSPFSGSLSICETNGGSSGNQPLFPVAARPAPQIPAGLKQRFLPFGNSSESAPLPGATEEPPRKRKKKKKKHQGEENQPPLFAMPLGEATEPGEAGAGGQHEADGEVLLAADSQPSSVADAQNDLLSGDPEDAASGSKKKKKTKKDRKLKEMVGEAEDGAVPLAADSQPSSAAEAQNNLLSGDPEDVAPASKKKKKRKDDRQAKEELGEEAAAPLQREEEDGTAGSAVSSLPEAQPNSAAFAHGGLLSGEAEAAGPRRKKKKMKKSKEDGDLKEEARGEAEAASLHQADGTNPISFQPDPAAVAQNSLLPGEMEDLASLSKRKKRKKERDVKEETRGEAEATSLHQEDGTRPVDFQPDPAAVAQYGPLPAEMEDLASLSKRKKRKKERDLKEEMGGEAEATLSGICSQPNSELLAQDGLVSGGALDLGPRSKKKKKRKGDQEVKEELVGEAEGLLGGHSETQAGEDSLPGTEEVTQGTQKGRSQEQAASPELFSSQEGAAEVLQDSSGPGPALEGGLVLAGEEPWAGSSSHKAKKKRKKEKLEEAAQPVPQEAESWAGLDTPLGGGGGQEVEPGREELSQKRKKKEHRRRQAAQEGLEKEGGDS